jgi:predicted GIY-YIG superfamily endonuclease
MNAQTALPTRTKTNIIVNEWQRISSRCQNYAEKKKQRNSFIQKLQSNGYIKIPQLSLSNSHNNPQRFVDDRKVFYLNIPFINDAVDTGVRRCFKHLGYNIRISHKGTTINQLLNPTKKAPPTRNGLCSLRNCRVNNYLCYKSMVVYQAECNNCLKKYIGSTKKFLHLRVQEHFNHRDSNIYKHQSTCKGSWSFSIKCSSRALQDLRWMEAITIKQIRPELNKKEDMMSLSQFLLV